MYVDFPILTCNTKMSFVGFVLWLMMATTACANSVSGNPSESGQVTTSLDEVDRYILAEMKKRRIPGLALGVVSSGKLVKASGYGLDSTGSGTPVTPQTTFTLTSVTKQFTAAAIMLLFQERKLMLDDSIRKFLNDTPETWQAITIQHLLTHTSGFTDRLWYGTDEDRISFFSRAPDFDAGERWEYSDVNYVLLGVLIELTAKKTYHDFLSERFFLPLGMKSTKAEINHAFEYRAGHKISKRKVWPPSEGGVISNIDDLVKWEGALHTRNILNNQSLDRMWTPVMLNDGSHFGYGFGWSIRGVNHQRTIGHGGRLGHYYLRLPQYGLAVIVLSNLPIAEGSSPLALTRGVARRYLPAVWPSFNSIPVDEDPNPQMTEKIKTILKDIITGEVDPFLLTQEFHAILIPNRRLHIVPRWIEDQDLDSLTFITCERLHQNAGQVKKAQHAQICYYKLAHPLEVRFFSVSFTPEGTVGGIESMAE